MTCDLATQQYNRKLDLAAHRRESKLVWSRKKFELGDLTKNSEPQKKHFFLIFHDAHFSNTPARIITPRHLCRWLLQAAARAQGQLHSPLLSGAQSMKRRPP